MSQLMQRIALMTVIAQLALVGFIRERLDERAKERGDVPGWVMITVMTAGLVAALWVIAGDTLKAMLSDALASVRG
jgi:hypothetical protein